MKHTPRTRRPRSAVRLLAGLALIATTLTGCAAAEPGREPAHASGRPVVIAVSDTSDKQQIMAEIYLRALARESRDAEVTVVDEGDHENQIESVASRTSDFIIGCTGDLLHQADPSRARDLVAEVESADTDTHAHDPTVAIETFESFRRSLPGGVTATDQSGAEACEDSPVHGKLPQQVVPVFHSSLFDREELEALDYYTKLVTTQDLDEMAEKIDDGATIPEVVTDWVGVADTDSGELGDSDSDDGGGFSGVNG
ncbi:hypothetical protein C3B44_07070 [Corynebacterium yudongzhengii]|uniref:ABC transporter substrate-binding protein n=1 Tax=Corynebacterium yudongzhengii TaxID=2080740 RepID=A0A2U1T9I5_9CORY|nr:hypothetical protein [Corynebacterium yudongzhengii]AWB82149.1 hypothetical protein C3B44_07070 [Corynebacterium yudongzhengii]PWC02653.1 hypothetical protein DF222_01540 [Corynebacterium yudongzhengii]